MHFRNYVTSKNYVRIRFRNSIFPLCQRILSTLEICGINLQLRQNLRQLLYWELNRIRNDIASKSLSQIVPEYGMLFVIIYVASVHTSCFQSQSSDKIVTNRPTALRT